jgi:hypothetical protein
MPLGRKLTFRQRKNQVLRGGAGAPGKLDKYGQMGPASTVVSSLDENRMAREQREYEEQLAAEKAAENARWEALSPNEQAAEEAAKKAAKDEAIAAQRAQGRARANAMRRGELFSSSYGESERSWNEFMENVQNGKNVDETTKWYTWNKLDGRGKPTLYTATRRQRLNDVLNDYKDMRGKSAEETRNFLQSMKSTLLSLGAKPKTKFVLGSKNSLAIPENAKNVKWEKWGSKIQDPRPKLTQGAGLRRKRAMKKTRKNRR